MTDDLARKIARAELTRRLFILAALFMAAIIAGVVVWAVLAIRTTQQEGSPAVKQIIAQGKDQKELLHTIQSCTDPKGKCYQEGQQRTADAVGSINEITIYAVVCGQRHPGAAVSVIRPCVLSLYNENHKN